MRLSPLQKSLIVYAFDLAKVKPEEVRFVIIDGSTSEGTDRKYSDYDIVVVKKRPTKPPGSVENLFGVFKGRIVSGWLVDGESFRRQYIGEDDEQFLWRRRQISKARLLYGNKTDFERVVRKALARRWNRRRQLAVIRYCYVTMLEYLGKMLNKGTKSDTPEFYQDGYIIAKNAALFVAGLNKIDLDSDKSMYQQILSQARIRPPSFERDFVRASGLSESSRDRAAMLNASKRLVNWVRKKTIETFGPDDPQDPGFWRLVREARL